MLAKIQAVASSLRKSEQRVARAVLADPEMAVNSSIGKLAAAAGVSEPTVIRFCRAIGYSGFQQFKLMLAQDIAGRMHYADHDIDSCDSIETLTGKVIDSAIANLARIRRQLSSEALEQAVALLAEARRIECYGLGGAGIVAADAQLKFTRLGVPTIAYSDAYIHNLTASLLQSGDVVVAFSNSGRSRDLIRSVDLARDAGAAVIAVTASGSPLAKRATVALTLDHSDTRNRYTPIRARIVPMVVIDILAIGVALKKGGQTLDQLARLRHLLSDKFL